MSMFKWYNRNVLCLYTISGMLSVLKEENIDTNLSAKDLGVVIDKDDDGNPVNFEIDYTEAAIYIKQRIRDYLSSKLKDRGFAKVSKATYFDFIIFETRKNSTFRISDLRSLYEYLSLVDSKLPKEVSGKNRESLDFISNMLSENVFSQGWEYRTTFSRVYDKKVMIIPEIAHPGIKQFEYNYSFNKIKFSMTNNMNIGTVDSFKNSTMAQIRTLFKYVDTIDKLKEMTFYTEKNETKLYDLMFVNCQKALASENDTHVIMI